MENSWGLGPSLASPRRSRRELAIFFHSDTCVPTYLMCADRCVACTALSCSVPFGSHPRRRARSLLPVWTSRHGGGRRCTLHGMGYSRATHFQYTFTWHRPPLAPPLAAPKPPHASTVRLAVRGGQRWWCRASPRARSHPSTRRRECLRLRGCCLLCGWGAGGSSGGVPCRVADRGCRQGRGGRRAGVRTCGDGDVVGDGGLAPEHAVVSCHHRSG